MDTTKQNPGMNPCVCFLEDIHHVAHLVKSVKALLAIEERKKNTFSDVAILNMDIS